MIFFYTRKGQGVGFTTHERGLLLKKYDDETSYCELIPTQNSSSSL